MRQFHVMLKPASSGCNMRCRYCFYADLAEKREVPSFGRMSEDTVQKILANIQASLKPGDAVTFIFQGGEPTLAGLPWYERFAELVRPMQKTCRIAYALQTNGLLLDDAWCRFLLEHQFLVGISMDAMPKTHNTARLDATGKGTYRIVEESIRRMKHYGIPFNVLCTLTAEIARHPRQVWNWIVENDFQYVQFTPCLDELGTPGASGYALHPKKFASFYTALFPLWVAELNRGRFRSIKLFDDVVNLLAEGIPTACGIYGFCQPQLVVEADGSVYPCDFYCIDRYCLGNLTQKPLLELMDNEIARSFRARPREHMSACDNCRYQKFCGGGCRRMQREIYCAPGENYCGYRSFLDAVIPDLQRLIAMQCRRRG